jgi:Uma2 family endonuclease
MSAPTDLVFESTSALTQEEFVEWPLTRPPSDCNHYGLLHGRVVMTPSAGHPHGTIDRGSSRVPGTFVPERRLGMCFGSSQGFELPSGDTVEPDFAFIVAYGQNGVREYWSVDPDAGELTVFSHREDRFDAGRVFPKGVAFDSAVLLGLAFDVGSVLPD